MVDNKLNPIVQINNYIVSQGQIIITNITIIAGGYKEVIGKSIPYDIQNPNQQNNLGSNKIP